MKFPIFVSKQKRQPPELSKAKLEVAFVLSHVKLHNEFQVGSQRETLL